MTKFNNNYNRDAEFTAHVSNLMTKYVLPLLGENNALKYIKLDAWMDEVSGRFYERLCEVTAKYIKDKADGSEISTNVYLGVIAGAPWDYIYDLSADFWSCIPLLDSFLNSFENFDPDSHCVHRDLPMDFCTRIFYYKNEHLMPSGF